MSPIKWDFFFFGRRSQHKKLLDDYFNFFGPIFDMYGKILEVHDEKILYMSDCIQLMWGRHVVGPTCQSHISCIRWAYKITSWTWPLVLCKHLFSFFFFSLFCFNFFNSLLRYFCLYSSTLISQNFLLHFRNVT